jgi:CRP/FNR family transcriptional regulator, cyclic AMP receptor protein
MIQQSILDTLSKVSVLRGLPPAQLEQLAGMLRRRGYRRGEVVFHHGDPGDTVHIICQGYVKIVLPSEGGHESLLAIRGPSDLFGEMALLDGAPRSATVMALQPLETATLSRSDLLHFLRGSPAAIEGLLAELARRLRQMSDELANFLSLDQQGNLAKKLLELAATYGRPSGVGSVEIDVPLTQEELGAMIGASRARVSSLLAAYKARGIISRSQRRITILKPEALRSRSVL